MAGVIGWLLIAVSSVTLVPLVLILLLLRRIWKPFGLSSRITLVLALLTLWPAAWNFGKLLIPYPARLERTRPAATVRLPMDGPIRVAWGGDRLSVNQHVAYPDQRWAYDLLTEPAMIKSNRLEDYGCFGKPVLAPVSARVHHIVDGVNDQPPGEPSDDFSKTCGNMVVLELDHTGTYLLICHMKRGSVLVRPEERIVEGQAIGACGNSGHTTEPHVHIQHQRQDPKVYATHLAEGLPLFFRDHDGPPMPEGGIEERAGQSILTGAIVTHRAR